MNVAGSRSKGSVPAIGAKPSNAGPMELAILAATSSVTGTPATSAVALICFAVGLVMWILLPLTARGCDPNPESPCSTPPDGPLYRDWSALALRPRIAAPQTGSGGGNGIPTAGGSGSADRR